MGCGMSDAGLLGPNGSGKTSLLKILTGLIHDYSGEVLIEGDAPGVVTKAKVAYLPEKTYLADWMRCKDAIEFMADFYKDFNKEKAYKMLDVFQLPPKQKIKTMSKGMQEKLQILLFVPKAPSNKYSITSKGFPSNNIPQRQLIKSNAPSTATERITIAFHKGISPLLLT